MSQVCSASLSVTQATSVVLGWKPSWSQQGCQCPAELYNSSLVMPSGQRVAHVTPSECFPSNLHKPLLSSHRQLSLLPGVRLGRDRVSPRAVRPPASRGLWPHRGSMGSPQHNMGRGSGEHTHPPGQSSVDFLHKQPIVWAHDNVRISVFLWPLCSWGGLTSVPFIEQ